MPHKIHMQDQAFNKVAQFMNHNPRRSIQLNIARINITLQLTPSKNELLYRPLQLTTLAH